MSTWRYALKIIGIAVAVAVFLTVAFGPTASEFRYLLQIIFDFVRQIAWPLAVVVMVFFLRKPLSDLIRRGAGKTED